MKKLNFVFASALLLAPCASCNEGTTSGDERSKALSWTITFDSKGGSAVDSIAVLDGAKATKPTDPTKTGYKFLSWCIDSACTSKFDWDTAITSNWTLYASWETAASEIDTSEDKVEDSSSVNDEASDSSSVIDDGDETGGGESKLKGHGPEGSTPASWYLVGSGSLWGDDGWTVAGGVQLFTNPNNLEDKGCLLSVTFASGDAFKVTDGGSTWFGYEKVDQSDGGGVENKGASSFSGVDDGYGGKNIQCNEGGIYDVYVNSSGSFWIQAAN